MCKCLSYSRTLGDRVLHTHTHTQPLMGYASFCFSLYRCSFGRCCFASAFCIYNCCTSWQVLKSLCYCFYDFLLLHALTPFLCAVPINVGVAVVVVVDIWCPPNFFVQSPISLGPFLPCPPVSRWVSDVVPKIALGLGHTRPRWSSSMVASPSPSFGLEVCAAEAQAFVLVRPWSCF